MSQRKNAVVLPEVLVARLRRMVDEGSFLSIEEAAATLIFSGIQHWREGPAPTAAPPPELPAAGRKKASLGAMDAFDGL